MYFVRFIFLISSLNLFSQSKNDLIFDVPIRIPLYVAGSFGELRPNHFHAGVDFSANYKIGDPVFAPDDGVVTRIKVSSFGYGKALYIKHLNGYTTVYGHLSTYEKTINAYVLKNHYDQKLFEIELFPLANELPVKKGDVIGYIGNTGGSGGPHLHYEIRNTQTEHILNPIALSLKKYIKDTEQPIVNGVYVYPLTNETVIDNNTEFFEIGLQKKNNTYISNVLNVSGTVGFGINTHDTQDGSRGKNGIYKILTYVNGAKHFEILFDEFAFEDSKYLNQYIDYKYYQLTGNRIQKLFVVNELPLSLIKNIKNNGQVVLDEAIDVNYKIEVYDAHDNKQTIEIPLKYKFSEVVKKQNLIGKYIDYLKDYAFEDKNISVEWDARTFFEDVHLNITYKENGIVLHKDEYPVQKNINVKIIVPENFENKDQTFIGKVDENKVKFFETWKKGNDFRIRTKELGTYELITDLEKPTITFTSENEVFTKDDVLAFEIEDKNSGIATFNGYLNEEWVLFDYDYKTKKLVHKLSEEKFKVGENVLHLEVTDRVGNSTTFEKIIVVN